MNSWRARGSRRGSGFVEHQDLRVASQSHRQGHLGPLAPRQATHLGGGRQVKSGETSSGVGVVPPIGEAGGQPERVGHSEVGIQRRVLGDEPDQSECGAGSRSQAPQDGDMTSGRCRQADDEVEQSGLARTVGSDQGDGPVGRDGQAAVAERPGTPVPLTKPLRFDDVHDAAPDEWLRRASCSAIEIRARMESSSRPAS